MVNPQAQEPDPLTQREHLAVLKEAIRCTERDMNIGVAKIEAQLQKIEARIDTLEKLERKRAAKKLKRKSKTKTKR